MVGDKIPRKDPSQEKNASAWTWTPRPQPIQAPETLELSEESHLSQRRKPRWEDDPVLKAARQRIKEKRASRTEALDEAMQSDSKGTQQLSEEAQDKTSSSVLSSTNQNRAELQLAAPNDAPSIEIKEKPESVQQPAPDELAPDRKAHLPKSVPAISEVSRNLTDESTFGVQQTDPTQAKTDVASQSNQHAPNINQILDRITGIAASANFQQVKLNSDRAEASANDSKATDVETGKRLRLVSDFETQEIITSQKPQQNAPRAIKQESFPWSGEITGTPSAALNADSPLDVNQANTIADLEKGTLVLVLGRVVNESQKNWLRVQVIGGKSRGAIGYVSGELVKPRQTATDEELRQSFVILKTAETALLNQREKPSSDGLTNWARNRVESVKNEDETNRYAVNPQTYQTAFNRSNGQQIKVISIEDFILFAEAVEKQYPKASPGQIVSEIRQIWFADENWDLVSAGRGITTIIRGGRNSRIVEEDIESKPNPIATTFDTQGALQGREGAPTKLIATSMGVVDISHVMAGIDVAINGMRSEPGILNQVLRAKYKILEAASGGDTLDFATWSGDMGQAYGDYLNRVYILKETGLKLAQVFVEKANAAALLADIHGYIATLVSKEIQKNGHSPTNNKPQRVSDILRNLYLVIQANPSQRKSYRFYFEKVAQRAGEELYIFVRDRTLSFARAWYAKDIWNALKKPEDGESQNAFEQRTNVIRERLFLKVPTLRLEDLTAENTINILQQDFNKRHAEHEQNADDANKIAGYIRSFIKMLDNGSI